MPKSGRTYRTQSGRELADEDIDRLADEVAVANYDITALKKRRRGRPSMGEGPAEIVSVRLDPQLGAALDNRVEQEHSSRSEVIRRALRRYLAS